jgi:hypothetical protein
MALGELGDTRAVPVLSLLAESAVGNDRDSGLGSAARAALRKLGVEAEVPDADQEGDDSAAV